MEEFFFNLSCSLSLSGFLVGLELRLVRAHPYVHLKYELVRGRRAYCDRIRELSGAEDPEAKTPDFLEATVFSKVSGRVKRAL